MCECSVLNLRAASFGPLLGALAGVHLLLPHAGLTLHVAAPAHLAVARQAAQVHGRVVAASAAHALAAGVLSARPAARAGRVARRPAEAGRLLQVDHVGGAQTLAVAPWPRQLRLACGGVGDAQHAHGRVVAVLEQAARVVEGRELLPAGAHGAGARHAVAFAGCFQAALHRLEEERKKKSTGEERRGEETAVTLIHCQLSYLQSLSGQSETVSCRPGEGGEEVDCT